MKKGTIFKDWLFVASLARELPFDLTKMERPFKVGKVETPEDLNGLTIGQLLELSEIREGKELFFSTCRIVLGMTEEEVCQAEAVEVVAFSGWVSREVRKINNLFERINTKPTSREIKAGIKNLQFGVFGLIDWYAQRMRITDHHEVEKVSWLIVYKCLEIDTKRNIYRRKLEEVIQNEHRGKH